MVNEEALLHEKKILIKFLILKILNEQPNITRYKVRNLASTNNLSVSISSFYGVINEIEKEGLVLRDGYNLFSLTSEGYKVFHELEQELRLLLSPVF